ncbi:MAG TPA: phosphopantetheine-binding protein [Acidimicrobiia bacterium]
MNERELAELALKTLAQVAPEVDPASIDTGLDLREDLDLDSMDFLNFVTGLSEATGVEIPERDYPELATIDGCAAYLAARA